MPRSFENRVTRYSVKDKPRKRWAVVQADSHVTLRDRSVVQQLSAHVSRQILLLRYESSWNRLSRCKQVSETSRRENEIVAGKLGEIILGLNEISNRVEARYLDPTFPTRAKSGYEGMRIVYTRVTRPRNQLALALFLPVPRTALFYPHFSPFLSLSLSSFFFHPTLPFASFERLDNENRSRVSVLNECLREK